MELDAELTIKVTLRRASSHVCEREAGHGSESPIPGKGVLGSKSPPFSLNLEKRVGSETKPNLPTRNHKENEDF